MNGRKVLAQLYIKRQQGTKADECIKMGIGTQEPKSKEYLLGAERITLKAITQLQYLHASESILMVWYQILANISYEIEQIEAFEGKE